MPIPIWIRNAGGWPRIKAGWTRYGGGWAGVKSIYVREKFATGMDTDPWRYEWKHVSDMQAPDKVVPGAALTGPAIETGIGEHSVTWTTTTVRPDADWDVTVRWYLNGIYDQGQRVAQSAAKVTANYDVADDISVEIVYSNEVGDGPITSLGPV